jgi:hypothetical protein
VRWRDLEEPLVLRELTVGLGLSQAEVARRCCAT